MSMYTTLLGSALIQRERFDTGSSIGDHLAQVLRCRSRLQSVVPVGCSPVRTLRGLTEELDYDLSLINLARSRNIKFNLEQFDDGERYRLEQALKRNGIRLDALHDRA